MKDLVALVADKSMEYGVRGLLSRHASLGILPLSCDVFVHPRRDPGCLNEAHSFLRPLARDYQRAIVILDHDGCGHEGRAPCELADAVTRRLEENGWSGRAQAVVVAPEVEVWVWSQSPVVADCLGWQGQATLLRQWLADKGYWPSEASKPTRPKEAMEAALRGRRKPLSSAIYYELATRVSLAGHTEPAFVRFASTLQRWFPQ